jgi:hypothetical protein
VPSANMVSPETLQLHFLQQQSLDPYPRCKIALRIPSRHQERRGESCKILLRAVSLVLK